MYVNKFDTICGTIYIYIMLYYINYITVVGKIKFTVVSTQHIEFILVLFIIFPYEKL